MKILMLGNSFTMANDMPKTLAHLTGAEVIHHTRGGSRLAEHLNPGTRMGAKTMAALESQSFDYVVLQEMSNGPITSPEKFRQNVALLCELIREKGAEPVLYATWAYKKDGEKLKSFGMDYREMAERMAAACKEAADQNNCLLAEVGRCFYEHAAQEEIYAEDGCHPNKRGSELAAQVIAKVILEDSESKSRNIARKTRNTMNFTSMEEAVEEIFTPDTQIISRTSVAGGDINAAWSLYLSGGKRIFAKTNTLEKAEMFTAEALGLAALHSTNSIGVPKVLAAGKDEEKQQAFLLMEQIESASRNDDYWETFGRELATMHLTPTEDYLPKEANGCSYGFVSNNFIGATPQCNTPKKYWVDFYRECRLEPQIMMAEEYLGSTLIRKLIRLLDRMEEYLREPEKPSLVHGDLWSGNQICGPDGKAWIIDPAVYVGDFETDLAMTELFEAFPESFYSGYASINPIEPEYNDRREIYHLYHMLNHLNLFGEMYLADVRSIVEQFFD